MNYINDIINYKKEIEKINKGEIETLQEEILKKNPEETEIYEIINERKIFLRLNDSELKEYSFLLNDDNKYSSFFSFIKMFKTSKAIEENLKKSLKNNMNVKTIKEISNKILLLRKFEKTNNIKPYDINFIESKENKK